MRFPQFFHRLAWRSRAGAATAIVAALALTGATGWAAGATHAATPPTATAAAPVAAPLAPTSYADAVAKAAPAVVTIRVEKQAQADPAMMMPDSTDPFFQRFFQGTPWQGQGQGQGRGQRQMPAPVEEGVGSGVIVSSNGDILTNNHVIDGADHVTVTLQDGRTFSAKVIGADPPSDLAVVKIDASNLPSLALGDSDAVRVGDVVLAVGDPLDVGQTVTMGIISAKGRTTDLGSGDYEDFLQTDAPINRGNSGGALITSTGELVGINSQIETPTGGNIGIGFAIPSNMAKNVMAQLIKTGHVRRGMLGVTAQLITSDLAKSLGLSSVHGALVADVTAGGPADRAGIKTGDVITTVDGQEVQDSNALRNDISEHAPGSTVTIGVLRNGEAKQVEATLGQMPAQGEPSGQPASTSSDLGMTLAPLTPSLAQQLGVSGGTAGVAVTDVDASGAAAQAGIQRGDVIRRVNGQAVDSPDAVRQAIAGHADRPALVQLQRGDQRLFVAVPTR